MSSHIRIRKSDQSPVTFLTDIIAAQGAPPHSTPTDGPSEGLQVGEPSALQGKLYGPQCLCQATIDKLTDDALLDIFDFYLNGYLYSNVDEWHRLVHVCQRWRSIVFASPHRLDLRLFCLDSRPVRQMSDIWPVLPLEIQFDQMDTRELQDNLIAALKHHNRVRHITLNVVPNTVWETLAAAMQVPFPELRTLLVSSQVVDRSVPVLPDSFLGGSAPRLRALTLAGIPFPAMLNLFLSASDLVYLSLYHIPHSGYISPESMVACLSSLNRLEELWLGFESPLSRPDQPSPPPQTRVVLPALSRLSFDGMVDYSEDFLARIDTPVLNELYMHFFMDLVFDIPHLKQFIGRANGLYQSKAAKLWWFDPRLIQLELNQPPGLWLRSLQVKCDRIDWQLDSMARVCGQLSPFFSSVERFYLTSNLVRKSFQPQGIDDIEPIQFLEVFRPFTAIRSLYVSKTLVPFIVPVLKVLVGESATEVLPNLRDLSFESVISRSTQQAIQPFIKARRLAGRPVAVHIGKVISFETENGH